jgi:putative hydrolase of the HAD superfamily
VTRAGGYRGVLWDFGGVLSSSPFEAFAAYERHLGIPEGFIRSVNATDPDANAWARFERSELDLPGFDAAFADESEGLGHRVEGREVIARLGGELRPTMLAAVRACRAHGLVTGLLTNNVVSSDAGDDGGWARTVDLPSLFDVVVESAREGVRKPEPAAYELVLRRMGVTAAQAVFLDDLGINLKPARAMGMATIKVVDPDEALDELEQLLGLSLREHRA